jgi:MFS transporter, DHA1 family, inner membrane transport protein
VSDPPAPKSWSPKASPDGLPAAALLGLLGTAGMFYVNLLPAIVSGLRDALGYSNVQAGDVASANVYGAAGGALFAVFIVRHITWKRAQALALAALILLDLLSTQVRALPLLVALRALHGLAGGTSIGIALAVMARTRVPQRAYGAQFTLQVLLGGLGLIWLPELAAREGAWVLFLSLAGVSAVTLLLLPLLADYPLRPAPDAAVHRQAPRWLLAATLAAIFLFQAANMGLFAFIIPLGRRYSLSTPFISTTLGIADWIAASGSLLAMWIGGRYGRLRPLAIALLVTIPATVAFLRSDLGAVFGAANILTGIAWSFVIPCLFSMCAVLDPSGRSATLGGFCSKMGLASGPLLAPYLIGADNYPALIWAAAGALLLVLIAAALPAARLERWAAPHAQKS